MPKTREEIKQNLIRAKSDKRPMPERYADSSIEELGELKMPSGKYKGVKFTDIVQNEEEYCCWVMEQKKISQKTMLSVFAMYLDKILAEEEEEED